MLTKNYLESEYKKAIHNFKIAIDENAQWEARKSMARLEMIAGQMYGFDYKVYTYRRQHNDYIFIPPDRGIGEAKEYIEEDEKHHTTLNHILEEVQLERNTILVVSSIHALGNTSEEILSRLTFFRDNCIPTIISEIEESWRIFHDPISPAAAKFTLNMIINTIHVIYDAPKYPSYFNYSAFTKDIIRRKKETITTEYRKTIQAFKELTWCLEDEENQTVEDIKYIKKLRDAHLKNLAELENYAEDIIDRDFRNRMHDELDKLYWYTQDDNEKLNAFRQEEINERKNTSNSN